MDVAQCQRCRELRIEWPIRSPSELSKAVRVVRANLDDGTLAEVAVEAAVGAPCFDELGDSGTWPDIVLNAFECTTCGARFKLFADTYHGSGGAWGPESAG